jgi:hypothetical protein
MREAADLVRSGEAAVFGRLHDDGHDHPSFVGAPAGAVMLSTLGS